MIPSLVTKCTPASDVKIGDTIVLFVQQCVVVYTGVNNFGQSVIRFTTNTDYNPYVSFIVIPSDFQMEVVYKEIQLNN